MLLFPVTRADDRVDFLQLHPLRLPSLKDRLEDVRREQRQPEQSVDEASSDALCFRELRRRPIRPSSSNRFHRCARASARISVSSGRGFAGASVAAVGRDDSISISRKSTLDSANRSRPSLPKVE